MVSRIYILFALAGAVAIWMGWVDGMDSSAKRVYSILLLGGLTPAMWTDTLIICGLRSLRSLPTMFHSFASSSRGGMLAGVVTLYLCFMLSPHYSEPIPHRYLMSTCVVATLFLLALQPVFILVLGASAERTAKIIKSVSLATYPLRVVALLNMRKTGRVGGSFSPWTDNLRTESDRDWRKMVDQLADAVTLIILDTRTTTRSVAAEVQVIVDNPARLQRTLFIVDPNGDAPAFTKAGVSSSRQGIRTLREDEVEEFLARYILRRHFRGKKW